MNTEKRQQNDRDDTHSCSNNDLIWTHKNASVPDEDGNEILPKTVKSAEKQIVTRALRGD